MGNERKKQLLSIYLLKESTSPDRALKSTQSLEDYNNIPNAKYIKKRMAPHDPNWAKYLKLEGIKISSASAVLFVPVDDRVFALSFGFGHKILDTNNLVDDFGLRTALNMLDKDKIKSSGVIAPSDRSKKLNTQTTSDSSLVGHDFKGFENILKNITGKVKSEYKQFTKNVTASESSIKITTDKPAEELRNVCLSLLKIYNEETYKIDFPEVFYIRPVKNNKIIHSLHECSSKSLKEQNNNLFLDIPEIVDFQQIERFRLNIKDRKKHFLNELNIESVYKLLEKCGIEMNNCDKWDIVLLDQNDQEIKSYKFQNCLVFDTELEDMHYHLSDGKWYNLKKEFSTELKESIDSCKKLFINDKNIPPFSHDNEGEYNREFTEKFDAKLLDKNLIRMEGYDKIELCDVFLVSNQNENTFIHVKRYHGGSSGLSHLFAQGDVSITLLNSGNQRFLESVRDKILDFDPNKKTSVHFIIVDTNQEIIPLFSCISLKKTIDSIKAKGAEVRWCVVKNEKSA